VNARRTRGCTDDGVPTVDARPVLIAAPVR
jgi:hypothetical protein